MELFLHLNLHNSFGIDLDQTKGYFYNFCFQIIFESKTILFDCYIFIHNRFLEIDLKKMDELDNLLRKEFGDYKIMECIHEWINITIMEIYKNILVLNHELWKNHSINLCKLKEFLILDKNKDVKNSLTLFLREIIE